MTRKLSLLTLFIVLCVFQGMAQDQSRDTAQLCVKDLDTDTLNCAPQEPMSPVDSLRRVVDSILNKDNYTEKKTRTKTVKKTVTQRGKRGKRRKRTITETVPYTVYVKRNFTVGCCIYDLTTDSMLYTKNADKMLIPASTQKLYVAAAMLEKRGLDYSFNTRAYIDGKEMVDSIGRKYLDGNIYVTTSCDPLLDKDDFDKCLHDIESLELDSINGQIIQCVTPKTQKIILPEDIFARYIVESLEKDSVALLYHNASEGGMDLKQKMRCVSRQSTPLEDVLERMLRKSNNTCAECMLLNLCDDDQNWTYSGCKDVVCKMVDKIYKRYNHEDCDISNSYYNIVDGSGLSHSNKTSAHSQVDLLRYIYSNKKLFNTIYEHLPVAGVNGTLSKRMTKGNAHRNVHAKTGTVNNTKTLSGYVSTANNHRIAFSILINDCSDATFAKGLQDRICELLASIEL